MESGELPALPQFASPVRDGAKVSALLCVPSAIAPSGCAGSAEEYILALFLPVSEIHSKEVMGWAAGRYPFGKIGDLWF